MSEAKSGQRARLQIALIGAVVTALAGALISLPACPSLLHQRPFRSNRSPAGRAKRFTASG